MKSSTQSPAETTEVRLGAEQVQGFGLGGALKMLAMFSDDENVRQVAALAGERIAVLKHQVADTCARAEKAEALLRECDAAINPPDRGGISLATWNERLQRATAKIRELFQASEPVDRAASPNPTGAQ